VTNKNVLRPVDEEARRLAGTLLRTERSGALATLEPATGIPLASRVSLAPDFDGSPIILISRLSGHFAALEASSSCSLLVGEPGKGDPLAHPRITVIGDAIMIEDTALQRSARHRFLARHPKAALYVDFTDFAFWRLDIRRASLIAGFGKAFAMTSDDILTKVDRARDLMEMSADLVDRLNGDRAEFASLFATELLDQPAGDWRIAGIDPAGLDLVCGNIIRRLWFDTPVFSEEDLCQQLEALARNAGRPSV